MSDKIYVQVGVKGRALPPGGESGQILQKASDKDFDLIWTTPAGGTSGNIPQPSVSLPDPDVAGGAIGTGIAFARQDHQHKLNVSTTATDVKPDGTRSLGSAGTYARTDHVHPLNVDATVPEDLGVAAAGSATVYAKRDHVHAMPDITDLVNADTVLGAITPTVISLSLLTANWNPMAEIDASATGAFTVSVNQTTWETQITTPGTYTFTYDGSAWKLGEDTVSLTDYGITITGSTSQDDTITVIYTIEEYSMVITAQIENGTVDTLIDLRPSHSIFRQMINDGTTAIVVETTESSGAAVFTAYAVGEKPSVDLTIQATRTESEDGE